MSVAKNLCFALLVSFFIAACSQENSTRTIETLSVAVLPDQSEEKIRSKYQPFLNHIKLHTGLNTRLIIPASYDELLQLFVSKKVEMALFGGVTYVMAHKQAKALPLVMRDVDGRFKSVAIVRVDNPAKNIQDLKGASISFGSSLSTSGHFMPRYFFQQDNIIPETFFSQILYSGAHDLTAEWVRDGKVDAGIANSGVVHQMFMDGQLSKDKLKIIWESPPFSDYVWAVQPDINKQQRTLIRDVFLHMNQDDEDELILRNLGANYYIPAVQEDFSSLAQIVQQMERQNIAQ